MRRPALLLAAGLLLTLPLGAAEPRPGDTRAQVENELGKPIAVRRTGSGELVAKYPRGIVTYVDGHATDVRLLTQAEWEKRQAEQKAEEIASRERARKAAEEKAARVAAGNAARDTLTRSDAYKQLSTDGKQAALAELAVRHPDAELAALRLDLELTASRENAARKLASDEARFRKEAEAKLAAFEEKLAELNTRLAESRETNAKLAARLTKAESDNATLLTRVNTLDEMVRTRTVAPAAASGGTSINLSAGSVGSSDPMRN